MDWNVAENVNARMRVSTNINMGIVTMGIERTAHIACSCPVLMSRIFRHAEEPRKRNEGINSYSRLCADASHHHTHLVCATVCLSNKMMSGARHRNLGAKNICLQRIKSSGNALRDREGEKDVIRRLDNNIRRKSYAILWAANEVNKCSVATDFVLKNCWVIFFAGSEIKKKFFFLLASCSF